MLYYIILHHITYYRTLYYLINEAKLEKAQELQERSKQIEEALPISTRQIIKQTKMVGAANWLSAIPLAEHGFNL